MASRIFVSYRREDTRHIAGRLSDRLEHKFDGSHVFMDVDTIEPGADFIAAIQQAVLQCDVLIAIIGRKWLTLEDGHGKRRIERPDDYVALEISTALQRGIPVIPVLVDEAAMPRPEELPVHLQAITRRNAARLDHETFRTDIQRILTAVDRVIGPPRRSPINRAAANAAPRGKSPTAASTSRPESMTPPRPQPGPGRSGIPMKSAAPAGYRLPVHRTVLRIALWWLASLLLALTAGALLDTIVNPTMLVGAIIGIIVMGGLGAFLTSRLYEEIHAQRAALDRAGIAEDDPVRRPVSKTHVRRVAALCAAGWLGFGLLIACTPRATPTSPSTGTPTSSVAH